MNTAMGFAMLAIGVWLGGLFMWWRLATRSDSLDEWENDLDIRQMELNRLIDVVVNEHHRAIKTSRSSHKPCDWDGQTYCITSCGRPATHRRISAIITSGVPVYELVCCWCSSETEQRRTSNQQ